LPVYVVAPNSEWALCVDYSRFQVTHPTIGYAATRAEPELANAPDNDGIYRMDIDSGDARLILSLRDLKNYQPLKSMERAIHWVTHLEINPASSRFLFIHRWTERVEDETCFLHRLFSANPDGTDLRLLECTDHPLPQLIEDFDVNAVGTFDYEKSEYRSPILHGRTITRLSSGGHIRVVFIIISTMRGLKRSRSSVRTV